MKKRNLKEDSFHPLNFTMIVVLLVSRTFLRITTYNVYIKF